MGEVVVSSDDRMEAQVQGTQNLNSTAVGGAAAAETSSTVMWERFLPKMVVRVLLVESDVSTRQIIAALLRKCSYRVAAVSDGLKAWELLKGRPHNIDLILTEVDLPSISGYALLSLIMEHDVCKNIPVIMMSSNDSVSTVYKCMLKGAADFLVKPLRKNELRNVWQHVWRKQVSSSAAGLGPPEESETQQKVEATAENNAVSNHSSGGYIQRNRDGIEKGSDAQSSCTKPEGEKEDENTNNAHRPSQAKNAKFLSDHVNIREVEELRQDSRTRITQNIEPGGSQPEPSRDTYARVLENSSREAIDFIGAFDNYLKGTFKNSASNTSTNKFDILPALDLSLNRSLPSGSVNQVNDERQRLNHSDVSAFSRYVNKPLQAYNSSSPSICNQQKVQETNSEKQFSNQGPDHNSETKFSYNQPREISLPIPVRGVRFETLINSRIPPVYYTQSGPSSLPSPVTCHQSDTFTQLNQFYQLERQNSSYQQYHNLVDQRMSNTVDQTENNKQGQKLENSENREQQVSHVIDQSGNSSFCTGNLSHQRHIPGSDSVVMITSECGNEEARDGPSHKSILREAALEKFRLKRKDRCFDKKVRYESRKKLAEQRPRVKGQFVRQVANDPQSGNSSVG